MNAARQMLNDYAARLARPTAWGHSTIAHERIGYCAMCINSPADDPRLGASHEVSGWRLLAMAEQEEADAQPAKGLLGWLQEPAR